MLLLVLSLLLLLLETEGKKIFSPPTLLFAISVSPSSISLLLLYLSFHHPSSLPLLPTALRRDAVSLSLYLSLLACGVEQ